MRYLTKFLLSMLILVFVISVFRLWWIDLDHQFDQSYSFVVLDANNQLLGARLAEDEQWRFPMLDSLPDAYKRAVICFEDKRFYSHFGIDLLAILRAAKSNFDAQKVISGASTIPMQLMRLSANAPPRNYSRKLIESYDAILYSIKYKKETLLRYYAAHAPFGGNVVGVSAAAWRYFGRPIDDLSLAEYATLAVLPNAPSLIFPGKNQQLLKDKRDRLLEKLLEQGSIDSTEYLLAKAEPIPPKSEPLPNTAHHLVQDLFNNRSSDDLQIKSSVDRSLQKLTYKILQEHDAINSKREIYNAALIVRDTKSGALLAYHANTTGDSTSRYNDMCLTPRSSGSILKPLLYALMIDDGQLGPHELLPDYPIQIDGFQPKNYDKRCQGIVSADQALARSLNIPFVLLLQRYGVARFIDKLQNMGFQHINKSQDHYGLSLILGGAEVTLFELTNAYSNFGRIMLNLEPELISKAAIWHMIEAMYELERPNEDGNWERFEADQPVAWKTGTSYGHRDAWAVALTPGYTVGVWAGNADGTPNAEVIGSSLAGNILFDLLRVLPQADEFEPPNQGRTAMTICAKSGFKANEYCPKTDVRTYADALDKLGRCHYHQRIYLDESLSYSVQKSCDITAIDTSWFVLNPQSAHYYQKHDPSYQSIPPIHPDCLQSTDRQYLEITYPKHSASLAIPNNLKAQREHIVCQAVHLDPAAKIFWHLDDQYLGYTKEFHKMPIDADIGTHHLSIVDDLGLTHETYFDIVQ